MKRFATLSVAAAIGTCFGTANAQEAVPLTPELFTYAWTVVEIEGQVDVEAVGPTTFFVADAQDRDVGGYTPCGDSWNGKIELDLPAVSFTDVDAFISDECPAYKNTVALIEALEKVTAAKTSPEGLEFLAEDGRRLLLLNAGG